MVKRYSPDSNPQEWLQRMQQLRGQDVKLLSQAVELYDQKKQAHLLTKGINIADILLILGLDNETLAATIVYPVLQVHEIHLDTITDCLGESCRKLLKDALQMQSLGKLHHIEVRGQPQIENLRKMLLAMVTDIRAVLIVLAERIWQLHQVKKQSSDKQKSLAQNTLDVFAPLANRLGIWQLKWEIEDLCLRYLQPEIYSKIAKWLASRRQEREQYIERVIHIVTQLLKQAHLNNFKVTGRVKHIYSIYRKMLRKSANMDAIYDVSAIRILVNDVADCYSVLSLLQDHWQHVPEEFDDYISQPKSNGYRSIHTVVIGPEGHYVEVQIRTYQMHEESELGMSAHWQYKEGVLQPSNYETKIALLRQIIDWQKEVVGDNDQQQKQLQDLFADRVYVFTPTGDIIDLPKGATPLDFAYHIHSEVGHRCRGAKVNGNIVQLTYSLHTGDRVEVLTAKQANPSRDWLNPHLHYLKTPRARAKVAHYFRMQDGMQHVLIGKDLFERELKKIGYTEKIDLPALSTKFNYKNIDEFYAALATGELRIAPVLQHLKPTQVTPVLPTRPSESKTKQHIQIQGINNLLTQIARCCKPLPGDAIIGYVTRNRGVSIHRSNCKNMINVKDANESRIIEVNWSDQASGISYRVDVEIRVTDREGLLRDITTVLATEKINVLGLQTQAPSPHKLVEILVTLEITNRNQLQRAMQLIQSIPNVVQTNRR